MIQICKKSTYNFKKPKLIHKKTNIYIYIYNILMIVYILKIIIHISWNSWEDNPPEGKIIECYFENECWHFMRFRNDKENANHESVVKKIMKSIRDNVEKEEVSKLIYIYWYFINYLNNN